MDKLPELDDCNVAVFFGYSAVGKVLSLYAPPIPGVLFVLGVKPAPNTSYIFHSSVLSSSLGRTSRKHERPLVVQEGAPTSFRVPCMRIVLSGEQMSCERV